MTPDFEFWHHGLGFGPYKSNTITSAVRILMCGCIWAQSICCKNSIKSLKNGQNFQPGNTKPHRKSYFPYLMYLENAGRGTEYSFNSFLMLEENDGEGFDSAVVLLLEANSFVLK